jgi:hypothetical protein
VRRKYTRHARRRLTPPPPPPAPQRLHGLRRDSGTPPSQRAWSEANPPSAAVGMKRVASMVVEAEGNTAGAPRVAGTPPLLPPDKFRRYQDLQHQIAARQQEMTHHHRQVDEHQAQATRHAKVRAGRAARRAHRRPRPAAPGPPAAAAHPAAPRAPHPPLHSRSWRRFTRRWRSSSWASTAAPRC